MTKEIIPNDGRAIDINSPTTKSIIEGGVPKSIRTWTVFKNTNNTLEGVEAFAFAMWQTALDEIEKESDNVVFMSDATVKLIKATLVRLEQGNEELKETIQELNQAIQSCNIQKTKLRRALEEITTNFIAYINDELDLTPEQVINIINEVQNG